MLRISSIEGKQQTAVDRLLYFNSASQSPSALCTLIRMKQRRHMSLTSHLCKSTIRVYAEASLTKLGEGPRG